MSADTMPCGCLGHADHEDLCRYPALLAELEREREKRKQAEDRVRVLVEIDIDALNRAVIEEARRAEQAERERDDLRATCEANAGHIERLGAESANWREEARREKVRAGNATAARERAEADNAALLKRLVELRDFVGHGPECLKTRPSAPCRCEGAGHPGTALLELTRAVQQYQYRDEATLLETFRRLMDERARIAHMRAPEYVRALEKVREAAEPFRSAVALNLGVHHGPAHARMSVSVTTGRGTALLDACAGVDALKGKP